tara:strand:- start:82 stop:504 length:423 start_codon:yes stop_codon:yes gene_type:complete
MHFKLYYKSYDFDDLSYESMKWYKQETGRDLRSDLMGSLNRMIEANTGEGKRLENVMAFIGDVNASILLWCIAKSKNSALQLSEISDGVVRAGWRPTDDHDEFNQPYTYILYKLAVDVDTYYREETSKKKALSRSLEQQD